MRNRRMNVLVGLLAAGAIALLAVDSSAVGTRRLALRSAKDFSGGELSGVAIDSAGTIRPGFTLGEVPVSDASTVWSALQRKDGSVLIATGHEGRLYEHKAGVVKEVAKADVMTLTSLVEAWGGMVLVGSLPGATLFEYSNGKLKEWLKLDGAEHIFALAFDAKAGALFVATGPEGRLFRITRDKKTQTYFDAEEQHLMSVALGNGKVYTGAGDKAKLFELSGPGRAKVLYDFDRSEVRAISVAKNGDVYAIANEIKARQFPTTSKSTSSKPAKPRTSGGKGTLYRFSKGGVAERLLDDDSHHFVSLALDETDTPYVGTGVDGQLYTVSKNRNSVLVADTDERQLAALVFSGKNKLVIAGDPVVIRPVIATGGEAAVWTSKTIDLGIRSQFGRLEWVGTGQLQLSTRSGNTLEPDDTWSTWSAPIKRPAVVPSPRARFLQLRARFIGAKSSLTEVSVSYVSDNLRAVVTGFEAETSGQRDIHGPDGKIRASGGPLSGKPESDVDLSWDVDNPDKDSLRFSLSYKLLGTKTWFDMLEPNQRLTKSSYSWNTRDLPEGRYLVRVVASDELSNAIGEAKTHSLVSHTVAVDNTAPVIENIRVEGRVVSGVVVDGVGPVSRIEVSLAGSGVWLPLVPKDGVFDETTEVFSADLSVISPSGPALITLRAYDQERNQVVRSVLLK